MQSASTNITTFPGKVGISNANPTHTLAIGSNVYVDDTGSNKLTVTGVISGDGLGISNIQTANVLGLTDNVTRITTVSSDLADNSSRITTVSSDLADNSSRITAVSSDLSDNSSRITTVSSDLADNSSRITTVSSDLSDNSSRITTVSSDLSDNSSRIDSLGDGAHTFAGVKTFQDDIILESNLRVNGDLTYANTVNMIVSDPIIELGANNQHTNDLGLVLTRHGNSGNDSNVAIFYDESHDNLKIGYTDDSASQTTLSTTATGLDVSITGNVAAAYDTNTTSYFGRAAVGYMGQSDQASFSHIDKNTSTNFALKQAASGATHLNTPTGQHIRFSVNAAEVGRFTGGGDFKVGANKLYVDTSASEVQMYSQATGSTAGPDLLLMRNNPNNGSNGDYIGQVRYEGISSTGTSRLYAKTTGKIKNSTNGSESGIIETALRTSGSQRISVRHSGDLFHIKNGTDLQVGEVANLYVDTSTSRVGIKKSNPSYTLDVDGDINLSGDFYQGGSPFVSSLWTSSGTDLYYSSGSVGISNAAPDHDLSVGSNLYVHDTGSNVLVVDGNVNVSNTISTHRLTLNNVSITTTMDLAQVSNVGNVTSNVLQFTNPTTAFVTTGAVGIGTSSPSHKLNIVAASGDAEAHIQAQGNAGDAILYFNGAATNQRKCAIIASNVAPASYCKQDLHFCMDTANDLGDVTIANSKMVITNGGNVGIGTTNPAQPLHIHNDDEHVYTRFTTTAASTTDVFDIACWNSTRSNGDHGIMFINRANTDMRFLTNDTERLRIKNGGNVGIGTTNPNTQLDCYVGTTAYGGIQVRSQSSGFAKLIANAGQGGHNSIVNAGDLGIVFSTDSDHTSDEANKGFYIAPWDSSSGASGIRINENGNVGIGTNNPIGRLDVKTSGSATNGGNVGAWDSTFVKFGPNSGTTGGAISFGAGLSTDYKTYAVSLAPAVAWCSHRNLAESWYWFYGSNQRMYLANNGNLTISGTYSPSSDDRIKTEEEHITNATDTLLKLKPQKYRKHNFEFIEVSNETYENAEEGSNIFVQGAVSNVWVRKDDLTFDSSSNAWYDRSLSNTYIEEAGLIAQDIWYDAPELRYIVKPSEEAVVNETRGEVSDDPQVDPDYSDWGRETAHVNYNSLIPYLIKSNQELHGEIQALKARITSLENA